MLTISNDAPQVKTCSRCMLEKGVEEFNKDKSTKDGLTRWCRSCYRAYNKGLRHSYKDDVKDYTASKSCSCCNLEKDAKEFYKDSNKKGGLSTICKSCDRLKNYPSRSSDKLKSYRRQYRERNPEKIRRIKRAWRDANRSRVRETSAAWKANHADAVAMHSLTARAKRSSCPVKRARKNLGTQLSNAVKTASMSKKLSILDVLDCTIQELRIHLESLFTDGMSWDNYGKGPGKWHIDHVTPLSMFNDPHDKRAWSKINLQPMWEGENCAKGGTNRPWWKSSARI